MSTLLRSLPRPLGVFRGPLGGLSFEDTYTLRVTCSVFPYLARPPTLSEFGVLRRSGHSLIRPCPYLRCSGPLYGPHSHLPRHSPIRTSGTLTYSTVPYSHLPHRCLLSVSSPTPMVQDTGLLFGPHSHVVRLLSDTRDAGFRGGVLRLPPLSWLSLVGVSSSCHSSSPTPHGPSAPFCG